MRETLVSSRVGALAGPRVMALAGHRVNIVLSLTSAASMDECVYGFVTCAAAGTVTKIGALQLIHGCQPRSLMPVSRDTVERNMFAPLVRRDKPVEEVPPPRPRP